MQGFSADAFSTNAFSVQAFSFGAAIQPPAQTYYGGGRSRSRSFAQPEHHRTGRTRQRREDDLLLMHRL